MKVLIIEDNQELARNIHDFLGREGYICETSETLEGAKEKLSFFRYDCILLDISLPDGNGISLLNLIRAEHKESNVLIISAKNALDDKIIGLEKGADDYITKPFHLSELHARIRAIYRRKSPKRTKRRIPLLWRWARGCFMWQTACWTRDSRRNPHCRSGTVSTTAIAGGSCQPPCRLRWFWRCLSLRCRALCFSPTAFLEFSACSIWGWCICPHGPAADRFHTFQKSLLSRCCLPPRLHCPVGMRRDVARPVYPGTIRCCFSVRSSPHSAG